MALAAITGWAHSKFGKLDGVDPEEMISQVAMDAIMHAGLSFDEIDSIHLGTFNGGFLYQDFPSSLLLNKIPELRFRPSTRVENACATGSAAFHSGLNSVRAGDSRHALVIGFEKMTERSNAEVGEILLKCSYAKEEAGVAGGFAGVFGNIIARAYFERYGDQSDAIAAIAAKNHRNGAANPYAHMRRDLGYEFCRHVSDKNPFVAGPLKRTDCSMVSDGAAALIISAPPQALARPQRVSIKAVAHVNDFLPLSRRDPTAFEGGRLAWGKALSRAGIALEDLSFVETHDCFTIAELIEYEAMGLAKPGQGAQIILDGVTRKDGRFPVNPSGGLKAKGHPVGATGVSMHVMAAMQLAGQAGDMQLARADRAGIFNMGGAAVANYVSILESAK
ncbi:acetyl-CoA acetyltransferase [Pollutimonas bauzanensis]|uniref:Acetyl-CoA C-acetyltransferase n=1 Tax=Pollutimonas bauzanensis TaxID=658167 RepID=A0A1M5X3B2_9BURK|nr:acetyl-CoA acetyltransferase [Pollutimonas bauzanensis]SHH94335.1 acetyl-CoA C-acetyltransferase [Pollutimonas bauzanensis]